MASREPSITDALIEIEDELIALSHDLHAYPELGGEEHRACERLTKIAQREGFEVQRPVAGLETAFVAKKALAEVGPKIAFLAEYDVLPKTPHSSKRLVTDCLLSVRPLQTASRIE